MKHIFTVFIALLLTGFSFSQNSNLIIFNNSGQQFFVILNGIKQNSIPKTNLKIEGLVPASYEVKLIFADGKTGDINKKIWLEPNMQYTARVDLKKPKKGKLRLFDYVNLREVKPNQQGTETVVYRPNDASIYSDQQVKPIQQTNPHHGTHTHSDGTVHDANHNVIKPHQTGTHTHSDGTVHDQNHNVIINTTTSPTGVNIGMPHTHSDGTIHDANHNVVVESQVTPNGIHMGGATHTHADGTVHDHNTIIDGDFMHDDHEFDEAIFNEKPPRCYTPIASVDAILKEVNDKSFSSDKMNVVTQNLRQQCINSDQAFRIVNAFTFEGDRLKIAKFLYNRMTDKQNAKKIVELFTFESTKEEYKIFIQ